MESITLTEKVEVLGGETMTETPQITADAYDSYNVTLPPTTSDMEVTLGGVLTDVSVFAIKASSYPTTAGVPLLSYKVHDSTNPAVLMSAMQLLAGGAVALLPGDLDKIYLSSTHTVAVTVEILIARTAVVPVP